ncbi:MAG TPA: hypothetical protein VFD27_03465 [Chthoniobacteraceae bacterium]|nr:hypothetical protein [Chthoniobacteraceae bacterium]
MKRTTLITAMTLALSAWPLCAQDNPPGQPPGNPRDGGGPGAAPHRRPPGIFGMLDANRDGALDQAELDKAADALRKLDDNGDGRVTPDEMRPRDDGQRRPDAGRREPGRDGDGLQAGPGRQPGPSGPRGEARRDGFGPRQFGDRIERRAPDRGVGPQRFAQRNPRMREDRAAAGPRAMGPRFDEMRRERGPGREQRDFAPPPPGAPNGPHDLRAPQPPHPPGMNRPGDRFQQGPPVMGSAPDRGNFMRRGPAFGQRPPPFMSDRPRNADRPPREHGQSEQLPRGADGPQVPPRPPQSGGESVRPPGPPPGVL